ncbi:MAG TPA: DEAD/DEAH box helicase [Gemmatales bacterium]|nr:DEAD/DEAH box helicase [Gemmatales bacterium]
MAGTLSEAQIREQLQSPDRVNKEPFHLLRSISVILNDEETQQQGRDLLLRALEWREHFGEITPILDSMARASGLFPYADPDSMTTREQLAYEFHRPLNLGDQIVFHREQAEVYRRLLGGESVILSAPTSFGKSRVIDAIIATGKYSNIVVIVPTLALIDETRRRLSSFSETYKIITHLSQPPAAKNIFVFTAERAVAYDKLPKVDFFVIDEFYKIGALEEDESRTVALNEAFYRLLKDKGQFYLLGPNIQKLPSGLEDAYRCVFFVTRFATVAVDTVQVPGRGKDIERLLGVLRTVNEPTLVYCSSPAKVNTVARAMLEQGLGVESPSMKDPSEWIAKNYHPDWILGLGLLQGIGIHHGRLPRSLAQFVVRAFNEERIKFLICTSTLIEGVNTKAKNVAIWDNSIGKRQLDYFTFNNIKGRSGRMFQHFVGRVYLFGKQPEEHLPFVDFPLFTQDLETPESLLIQLDPVDLSDRSKERVKKYSEQKVLSLELLRKNKTIDPESQVRLARHIQANAASMSPRLAWRGFPREIGQLQFVCELLWEYLVDSNKKQGVFSGKQLAFKIWQLFKLRSTTTRVREELKPGQYAAKTPDEAVERVLQFERNWAGFELPRLLSAVSAIQQEVLSRLGFPYGDYSAFASQAESLFRSPVVAALDEYGIPLQVAEQIQNQLRTRDDLDIALTQLKSLDVQKLQISEFAKELIADSQNAL